MGFFCSFQKFGTKKALPFFFQNGFLTFVKLLIGLTHFLELTVLKELLVLSLFGQNA